EVYSQHTLKTCGEDQKALRFFMCAVPMASDGKSPNTVISQTRFLVVDPDPRVGEGLRRFLLSEKSPAVHVALSPVLGLRILQDRRTPVDCVICSHGSKDYSALDFLAGLRAGRWGGLSLQHIKFILMMPAAEGQVIEYASSLRVTGFIIGGLNKD